MKLTTISRASLGAALLACTAFTASAETLRFSSMVPPGHMYTAPVLEYWANSVAEVTEGRVTVEFLPKMAGSPTTQVEVVEDGLADVSFINPGYWPGRFDLLGIAEAPAMSAESKASSVAIHRFYEQELKDAGLFEELHLVMLGMSTPGAAFTLEDPITSAADLADKKIRNPLPTTKILLEELGAVPISKPAGEAYELMASGIVDGSLAGLESVFPYQYPEIVKSFTMFDGGLYNPTLAIIMNKDKWESISEEDQAAINEISGEHLARISGQVLQDEADSAKQRMIDMGIEYVEADEAFMEEVRAAAEPIYANLRELAAKEGLEDPENVLERFRALIDEVAAEQASTN